MRLGVARQRRVGGWVCGRTDDRREERERERGSGGTAAKTATQDP